MAHFEYEALTPGGRIQCGVCEADTPAAVRAWVREQGWVPVSVKPQTQKQRGSLWRRRVPLETLLLVLEQLQTLLEAGTSLSEALRLLAAQASGIGSRLAAFWLAQVEQGQPLAQAMARSPYRLPETLIAAVRAGEESGHLPQVLAQLIETLEAQASLRQKLSGALIYPMLMIVVAVAIVAFLLVYVVPKIVAVFDSLHQALPPLTLALIHLSAFLQHYGLAIGLMLGAGGVALAWTWQRPAGRAGMQRMLLRLPGAGTVLRTRAAVNWAQTLAMLLDSGVPIVAALNIAAASVDVLPLRSRVAGFAEQVARGRPLHALMAEAKFFPPMMTYLAQTGEANGQLPRLLGRAAQRFAGRLAQRLQTFVALLEPIMIIMMGGVVLTIVLAIMLPIFSMNQLVGQ